MLHRIHVVSCSQPFFTVLVYARVGMYVQVRNTIVAFGYVYIHWEENLRSPKCCINRETTSTGFLEVQILLRILVHDWDLYVSSARSTQNSMRRKIKRI